MAHNQPSNNLTFTHTDINKLIRLSEFGEGREKGPVGENWLERAELQAARVISSSVGVEPARNNDKQAFNENSLYCFPSQACLCLRVRTAGRRGAPQGF